jgi:hypothetical protein
MNDTALIVHGLNLIFVNPIPGCGVTVNFDAHPAEISSGVAIRYGT